ncbi:MAG: carbohydrate kinase family protein, partial [Micrococcales bacterium]
MTSSEPRTQATTWIVGPVAWDSVVYTKEFPRPGAFTQGIRFNERAGGTGANVARALASAGVRTGFVGYLGSDSHGEALQQELADSKIHRLNITRIDGPTSHVMILVDASGDRTILGLAPDHLDRVTLQDVPLQAGDTVVFVVWR